MTDFECAIERKHGKRCERGQCESCAIYWPDEDEPQDEPDGPLTHEGLRVCREMCSTCIFRPGNLMQVRSGRVRQMIDDSLKEDSFIPCHKTLDGERAVCRGFYDRHKTNTLGCRLGQVLGVIEVDPEAGE